MLNVGDPTKESPPNIMQSESVGGVRGHVLFFVDANFRGVIIEHTGQNVIHVPGEVFEAAEVFEDVLWDSALLEETVESLVSVARVESVSADFLPIPVVVSARHASVLFMSSTWCFVHAVCNLLLNKLLLRNHKERTSILNFNSLRSSSTLVNAL
jgi:hypothetical protein